MGIMEWPANIRQLSMSHQLLPKDEWTKPEEVRLSRETGCPGD
jgi:hypothetical protein